MLADSYGASTSIMATSQHITEYRVGKRWSVAHFKHGDKINVNNPKSKNVEK